VVLKLFNAVRPECAVFGKKDYQQLLVVRHMVRQLAIPVKVLAGETRRASDGLALSSRNGYLSDAERAQAPLLARTLGDVAGAVRAGRCDWTHLEQEAQGLLKAQGWAPDYVALRLREGLLPPPSNRAVMPAELVVLAAARLGRTRLIDNLEIDPA
jgi:pantoate--beta-alanine ligase